MRRSIIIIAAAAIAAGSIPQTNRRGYSAMNKFGSRGLSTSMER